MFVINKFLVGLTAVLLVSGCASAVFPDFDDNMEDIQVSEGGRVAGQMPEEGNSLSADAENVAYENEAQAKDDLKAEKEEKGDLIATAETKPVETEELDDIDDDKFLAMDDEPVDETVNVVAEENVEKAAPSVRYLVETIYFDNGSSYVAPSYRAKLRKVAKQVKENDAMVYVYGHSSSRTRDTDPISHKISNFKASMDRAQNVAAVLKRAGVPADKIVVEAMSDSAPAYLEVMPEGERLNRRAEVYIAY